MHDPAILRGVRLALALCWGALGLYVLLGSIPDQPLRPRPATRMRVLAVTPQGWAFFTRNPREPADRLYRRASPSAPWVPITRANAEAEYGFGLLKTARARSVELGTLIGRLPRDAWRPCTAGLAACAAAIPASAAVQVTNRTPMRMLCGEFLVERQPPVPWAWSGRAARVYMPAQLVLVDARCG